jgi:hypothetical protein
MARDSGEPRRQRLSGRASEGKQRSWPHDHLWGSTVRFDQGDAGGLG